VRTSRNIVSICRWLPTPENQTAGVFVLRRLEAMAAYAHVNVLQPVPYFPQLRPMPAWARQGSRHIGTLSITHTPMFYVPKVLKRLDGFWLYRSVVNRIRSLHAQRPIGLLDAHFGYPDGVGTSLAAQALRIPFFVTFRGLEADYVDDDAIGMQIRRALRHAAGVVCVSRFLRDVALRYGADRENIRVIHNAVDRSMFAPKSRTAARDVLGIPGDVPLVVSVGHLLAVKGHDTLIEAFAKLRAALPAARLAIVGGASHERAHPSLLESRVRELGLGNAVIFAGKVPPAAVATWLNAANVFALATRREGCCNAILEALAVGTPVVTTPVGENEHFVEHRRNGYLVPVDEPQALAAAIERALSRQWDAEAISAQLGVGDWKQTASQVLDFFDSRLQDAPRRETVASSATHGGPT
jgi:glycosyltransferase involved in cell wall biosynthesis